MSILGLGRIPIFRPTRSAPRAFVFGGLALVAGALAGCGATLNSGEVSGAISAGAQDTAAPVLSGAGADPNSRDPNAIKAAEAFAAVSLPGSSAYKIGPLDVLDISVFKVTELSRSVQVSDIGTINLPLVGDVQASGKTAREIERDLTKKLGAKYLQSPQVTVYVKEYNSQRVTVEGAVKKPGVYPIRDRTTLLQLVAMAEGLDAASDESVLIFRTANGKRTAARFDIDKIRQGASEDPTLQQGDVLVASTSATKAAFNNVLKALPAASIFLPLL